METEGDTEQFLPASDDNDSLGGMVHLDQMPKVVDTLPAIELEESRVEHLKLSNPKADDTDEEDAQTRSERPLLNEAHDADKGTNKSAHGFLPTRPQSKSSTTEDAVDLVFATENISDRPEEFGGIVEMPQPLPVRIEEAIVSFDSIIPKPPRIDQIISRPAIVDVEEEPLTSEERAPISINMRASIPAALMLIPNLLRRKPRRTKRSVESGRLVRKDRVVS